LSDADIGAYRDFINTIVFEPNPNQNLDRTLPAALGGADPIAGQNAFMRTNYTTGLVCNNCHAVPSGSARFIIGASALREPQDFKVPQLRNIYQKTTLNRTHASDGGGTNSIGGFGFLHDGTFEDIFTFLSQPVFQNFANDSVVKSNVQAYLLCFDTGTAPAVGYSRTATKANVDSSSISNDWALLEAQAAATNIDLIAKGMIAGRLHGFLYQPSSGNYLPDSTNLPAPYTHGLLLTNIRSGDTLTLMGVPPGSGIRMGIDRNEDGVLDADVPPPRLQIAIAGSSFNISWPLSAAGYVLETTTSVPGVPWTVTTNLVQIVGSQNYITNPLPLNGAAFYRLRLPFP
jgi:hypothetical protein